MRVAYIVGLFPSVSETFILREIIALEACGVDVALFALTPPMAGTLVHDEARPYVERVRYRPSRPRLLLALSAWAELARAPLRALCAGYAVFRATHCPARTLAAVLTGAWFARRARGENIEHVHAHFAYAPADVARAMAAFLKVPYSVSVHAWDIYTQGANRLMPRLRRAAFTVACTEHGRARVLEACPGLDPESVHVIRHGVFIQNYRRSAVRAPVLLAVGRLEEKKGMRYLIDACRILSERGIPYRCMIAGDGSLRQTLEEQIKHAALTDRVVIAGATTQRRVRNLCAEAAVFVAPSIVTGDGDQDGVPNSILEALACGVPVVASAVGAIPEAVEDGVNGFLVEPGQPGPLADRLSQLLRDEVLRARLGDAGVARVTAEFDITRNVGRLAGLLGHAAPCAAPDAQEDEAS